MRVDGPGSVSLDFLISLLLRSAKTSTEVQRVTLGSEQLDQLGEIMNVLQMALYQYSQLNVRLVRIIGALCEGRGLDTLA